MASESLSSEKKLNLFQRYIFNTYKYQSLFNINTKEMKEKIGDALWPFHPENQPEGLIEDYEAFCKKLGYKK